MNNNLKRLHGFLKNIMVISHLMAYLQQPRDAVLPVSFWTGRVSWNRSIAKSSAFVIWSQQHFRWSVYTINHELVWAVPFPVTGPIFSMWLGVIWIGHRALQIFGRQLRRHEWLTRFTWNKSRNAVYKYFNCVWDGLISELPILFIHFISIPWPF